MELMKDCTAETQRKAQSQRRETNESSAFLSAKTPRLGGEKIITGNLDYI